MIKKVSIFLLAFTLVAAPAFAGSSWTSEGSYGAKTMAKLGFGLENALLGWTEIFTEIAEADNKLVGVGNGLLNFVGDTVGGVLHVATFPCPNIDIPLPQGGVGIL